MTRSSEEGRRPGLGWVDVRTVRFQPVAGYKVPHMGWNELILKKPSALFADGSEQRFYFVHSYHLQCDHQEDVLATAAHGYEFAAAFSRGNVYGVQFHPEKSHKFGMELLRRFAAL